MRAKENKRRGFSLIELLIVIAVIAILVAIALPNLLATRQSASETGAAATLRTINQAEQTYRSRNKPTYGSAANMQSSNMIPADILSASSSANAKSGYTFVITPEPTSGPAYTGYMVVATPVSGGGTQTYYTDESGTIYSGSATATGTYMTGAGGPTGFTPLNG